VIPNAGLNNIGVYPAWRVSSGTETDGSGSHWLAYAAISEDSAEPLATDTNIGTEKMRTNSNGGFAINASAIRDPVTSRVGVSIERPYVFDITSSMNITKYGYVPLSSGGNFSWIDLIRVDPDDPESAPVTLTLGPGDQLQLWCTLTITVPWSVDLESFVITGTAGNDGAGTHDAYCGFFATGTSMLDPTNSPADSIACLIADVFWPAIRPGRIPPNVVATAQAVNAARDASLAATLTGQAVGSVTVQPYVAGNHYRDKTFTFTTSQANMAITGMAYVTGGTIGVTHNYGFKVVFSNPSTFVKANTHELTLTFRVSWQEA